MIAELFEGSTQKLNPSTSCPKAYSTISPKSVSFKKPMQDFGGGIKWLFNIWNSRRSNNKNFIKRFQQQQQQQLEPILSTFIPGDEPIDFIDTQTSKQQSIQKRFYQKGLHKWQERFSRALLLLLETNKLSQTSSDDELFAKLVKSNKTIDMSHIDFNKGPHWSSSLTSNDIKEKLLSLEPIPAPSEEPT